ncbi:MAG: hypothetical protein JW384_01442 [Nitrosomonadaceae bacterium]|nr:hypothetical protein [Nitrosomonadaceae bacterium]
MLVKILTAHRKIVSSKGDSSHYSAIIVVIRERVEHAQTSVVGQPCCQDSIEVNLIRVFVVLILWTGSK